MICDAKVLSPEQKAAIEGLPGHPVGDQQSISVRTFESVTVSAERQRELA